MVAVNVVDGVKYGFRLLGYLLAVFIVGGILLGIGSAFAPGPFSQGNPILALIFVVAGVGVLYAGGLGLLYKVIADGVETGTLSAERGGGLGTYSGSGPGGGAPANRQQAAQTRQQAQPAQQGGHQQARQGGQQTQQSRGGNQAAQGGNQGAQGQQPPQDWEPGN